MAVNSFSSGPANPHNDIDYVVHFICCLLQVIESCTFLFTSMVFTLAVRSLLFRCININNLFMKCML